LILSIAALGVWFYWWTTYATFEYRLQPVVILEGQHVSPDDFLYPSADMEEVGAAFLNTRFSQAAGLQNVPLTLTLGWRSLDTVASLYVLTHVDQITTEFTVESPDLIPLDLLTNAGIAHNVPFDVHFTEQPLPLAEYPVGEYILHLALNDAAFEVRLNVTDTTAPTATAVNKTIRIGEEVKPEDFVTDIFDASPIASVTFVDEPNIFAKSDQIVEVAIEDEYGNSEVFAAALTIILNQAPPVIEGTQTIESLKGNPIMYRQGVTAHDDFGRELDFEVDSSMVDQHEEGKYTVTYKAVDFTGLSTEIEVTVLVINVDPEEVNERVDEILASILTDGMSQVEELKAIHTWVRRNVSYSASMGGPQSVYEGAYRALRDRRGNCYIFYSISDILLTRAGIPNMKIVRIEGTPTRHLWNLVNPDGLGWYHFDSLPTRFAFTSQMYMFTASDAKRYSRQLTEVHGSPNFFTYDPDLYPEIVEE